LKLTTKWLRGFGLPLPFRLAKFFGGLRAVSSVVEHYLKMAI